MDDAYDLDDGAYQDTGKAGETLGSPSRDSFLQALMKLVEQGVTMTLTLQVGGMLVSGTAVSFATYKRDFLGQFAAAAERTNKSWAEAFRQGWNESPSENLQGSDEPLPEYVHLKGARFLDASGHYLPEDEGALWRGRLSEVSGFILGGFRPSEGSLPRSETTSGVSA